MAPAAPIFIQYNMEQFIVSARKYRPDSFETLIGQDNIVQTLKNSIKRGQLAHAYLFCGPRGVGKTSAARIFAKIINCENPSEDMEPCGHCESCVSFREGRSYCIHELDAASNNSVDDIKALIDQVNIPPQVGKYSVFIVDEVHMLSQAAFNAFLKTLEEPPAHAIFILATTEKHKILPTILSRCQTYDFNRISIQDIVKNLRMIATKEDIEIDDESLHVIAMKADGAMRDALTIFDQSVAFCGTHVRYEDIIRNLNVLDYENCFTEVEDFLKGDYAAALLKFDEILSKGFNALYFVSALSSHFRDLIISKSGGLDSLLELPDSLKKKYKEQSDRCSLQFLYDALSITTQCESSYRASVNPRLHIEFALMRLSFLGGGQVSLQGSNPRPMAAQEKVAPAAAAPRPVESAAPVSTAPSTSQPSQPVSPAQPAQSAQPSQVNEAPVRERRRSARASLSISAAMDVRTSASAQPQVEKVDTQMEAQAPSDDVVRDKWKEIAGDYPTKPRLATTISNAVLQFSDAEDGVRLVTFLVSNEAQRKWIEGTLLKELEEKLWTRVESRKVRLAVGVQEAEEVKTTNYTPKEKALSMAQSNPEVGNLIADMELDV